MKERSTGPNGPIFTVGHCRHPFGDFVALLLGHRVTAVADVRSAPYSRWNPAFRRRALEGELNRRGFAYSFLGRELGGRPADPGCYDGKGRVQYDRVAKTALFASGIERVLRGAERTRIALLCAEADPSRCPRTLLVAPALQERGLRVRHILADGTVETHDRAMDRLAAGAGIPASGLFGEAGRKRALEAVARRIAYRKPTMTIPERRSRR